jgi:hypothetical protein
VNQRNKGNRKAHVLGSMSIVWPAALKSLSAFRFVQCCGAEKRPGLVRLGFSLIAQHYSAIRGEDAKLESLKGVANVVLSG